MQDQALNGDVAEIVTLDDHRPKARRGGNKKGVRRSFGNIRKLPSGRFQASYLAPDGKRLNAETTFDTRGDANTWLSMRQAELVEHRWMPPAPKVSTETFGEYAARWITTRELKPRTRVEYRRLLNRQILPTFADQLLTQIDRDFIRNWYADLDPTMPTRRAHSYALLRTILGSAVDDELIAINPARIKGAGSTKRVHKIRPATIPELTAIIDNMPPKYALMIMLAAWCQLRFGEIAELRRKDIDLDELTIRVRRGLTWVNDDDGKPSYPVIGDPKSDAGIRDVTIPPHLVPMIEDHLRDHAWPGPDGLLFYSLQNRSMQHSTLYDVYMPARAKAGRPDLRFHDLRHTGATLTALAGGTIAELMQRLGHSTPQMAMRYQHVADGRQAELAAKLSEFANATPKTKQGER